MTKNIFHRANLTIEGKFRFLLLLIDGYTKKISITNRLFYLRINRHIRSDHLINFLHYSREGLKFRRNNTPSRVGPDELVREILAAEGKSPQLTKLSLYIAGPYLNSLSRLLGYIFEESSRVVGEQGFTLLQISYHHCLKQCSDVPDLSGYLPVEIIGFSFTETSSPFGQRIMEHIIDYLVLIAVQGDDDNHAQSTIPPDEELIEPMNVVEDRSERNRKV
jgi:hypothetical protein